MAITFFPFPSLPLDAMSPTSSSHPSLPSNTDNIFL